ncbi:HNH endonuclease [Vibrio fluvialis]|uniref:HNH endonuclease n=1 Tax=Vibrio furnissii TaxID=29494 RepID=UPI0015585D3F|nr:HNH endonuclease [Vibrio furnissii]EKO3469056.1 HNH endonuclease [Vibrio fluvialis]MBY7889479.1 HNH endonuclease [Vibrio fluvialis]MBY8162543.1 HNH endonuclease [Vibrio fluvialis]HDM8048746.1 HNH endonuclease [Vibrio fluvialis]
MIKLERLYTPLFLNPSKVNSLTQEYLANGTSVWAHNEIKKSLLELSHNKCAYCECLLNEESKYMEVEHFEDKGTNPNKVVVWSNLLPSCKRCNVKKGTHDVLADPIINPFDTDPKDHLEFHLYQFRGATDVGKATEEVLDINNYEKVLRKRFDIGNQLMASISGALDKLEGYKGQPTVRNRNKLLSHVEGILQECTPCALYSATTATVLHKDKNFINLMDEMKICGIWNDELENLKVASLGCVLKCA